MTTCSFDRNRIEFWIVDKGYSGYNWFLEDNLAYDRPRCLHCSPYIVTAVCLCSSYVFLLDYLIMLSDWFFLICWVCQGSNFGYRCWWHFCWCQEDTIRKTKIIKIIIVPPLSSNCRHHNVVTNIDVTVILKKLSKLCFGHSSSYWMFYFLVEPFLVSLNTG